MVRIIHREKTGAAQLVTTVFVYFDLLLKIPINYHVFVFKYYHYYYYMVRIIYREKKLKIPKVNSGMKSIIREYL